MKTVLVTGSAGFVGKNLLVALMRRDDVKVIPYDLEHNSSVLEHGLAEADIIYHLAGVNRPQNEEEFISGNAGLTEHMLAQLAEIGRKPTFVITSSIQAALDNPYGCSKKAAEDAVLRYKSASGAPVCIYRLPGVFGKWSRPNYNTVVATFCHNIARNLDISISDPNHEIELVYIDDVVSAFLSHLDKPMNPEQQRYNVTRTFRVTLGELAERIRTLRDISESLVVPDLNDVFTKCLYATYLSFLPEDSFASSVDLKTDDRGWLFELIKSEHFGQIFVSKTLPGITRGNHYHDTKLEKFCVIQGQGMIRFRKMNSDEIIEYSVDDKCIKIVDIPPGYTHSIENNGSDELICLFWANQIFDPACPDTYYHEVLK